MGMRAAMDGCDRNTRDAGGAESSHRWLLTGTKGAAKDGRDGDKKGAGPWGQENQAWMTPWVIHIQTR